MDIVKKPWRFKMAGINSILYYIYLGLEMSYQTVTLKNILRDKNV